MNPCQGLTHLLTADEGGEAIGLFANDTQMASYAVKQGIVSETKEWANLDEARKQATRLQYAQDMMAASGATGQAAKEAGQYANVQAELTKNGGSLNTDRRAIIAECCYSGDG